jgi:hypothetical protein
MLDEGVSMHKAEHVVCVEPNDMRRLKLGYIVYRATGTQTF